MAESGVDGARGGHGLADGRLAPLFPRPLEVHHVDANGHSRAADIDAVELTRQLIRCRSVTPANAGCLEICREVLGPLGFTLDLFHAGEDEHRVTNLIGSWGHGGPILAFAGHTDVVPAGQEDRWSHPPFGGHLADGRVWGRGAVDMKGAVAAFLTAAHRYVRHRSHSSGTLIVLLTGDEEVGDENGMRSILQRMRSRGIAPDCCLVGEPSNEGGLGQGIRIGRRGSLNVKATAEGIGGHVAWPDRAKNALHAMMDFLTEVRGQDFGSAEACFPATNVEVTAVGSDSEVSNVIPGRANARLNIRFNRLHSGAGLVERLETIAGSFDAPIRLASSISGEPYLSEGCVLTEILAKEIESVLGHRPEVNAGGGVSDGRFLRALCPVVEFGLVGDLAHKTDENAPVADIAALTDIYAGVLRRFFASPPP